MPKALSVTALRRRQLSQRESQELFHKPNLRFRQNRHIAAVNDLHPGIFRGKVRFP